MQAQTELVDLAGLISSGVFGSKPPGKRTILRWVADGRLPSYKVGRLRRFDLREVRSFIRECRVATCHE